MACGISRNGMISTTINKNELMKDRASCAGNFTASNIKKTNLDLITLLLHAQIEAAKKVFHDPSSNNETWAF